MLRVRGILCMAIMMFAGACVADATGETNEPAAVESELAEVQAAGCSVLLSCNAPGGDGTRCRQQGCSLRAAELECELEALSVCGAVVCPVILIKTDGTRENLCRPVPE